MAVKKPVRKAPTKVTTTKPSVTVETKKITNTESCCSTTSCRFTKHFFIIILLIANTVLLSLVLMNQTKMEAMRAGGAENYTLLKQVFETEGYKMQQKQQLEQALQILSQPQEATPSVEGMQIAPQQPEQVQ